MSQKLNTSIARIGIDIGKNSFHIVGHDKRGAIMLRQKWSRGQVNAGSARVRDWLAGRRALPGETSAYVRIVTGYSPEQWAGASAGIGEMQSEKPVPCREIAGFVARTPPPASTPTPVWGVELVGGPTDETALAAYRRLEQKYASILGGRQIYIVHHGLGRGSMGWAHVHVGADNRPSAEKLCADLRGAGVSYCEVQRARSTR